MQEVLVVDDDGIYRTIMMRVLTRAGFAVSGVRSGREALDHLEHGTPSIVVTDILMPDMDGLELIRAIRRTGRGIGIVAISGGGDPIFDFLPAASVFGADVTLRKPFELSTLVTAVQSLLISRQSGPHPSSMTAGR
jgi:CheY-like chemotaxis protein